jgi:4-diphosphocytidyl-2-C-methyl-D-erythritol kinase
MNARMLHALAPGKVNLCLFLGPTRADGLHELVSLVEPLSLADELRLEAAPERGPGGADEVHCAGVSGPNLAAAALAAYRELSGWDGPPQRLEIVKRVPIAAGMGGGSGDAAAALRLVAHAAGRPGDPAIAAIAPSLGADVPGQVAPALALVGGAGEEVVPAPARAPHALLVLPSRERLSTPDVFREADRLRSIRTREELTELHARLLAALAHGSELPAELIVNDLEAAARSLCPSIEAALDAARAAGARQALVSGSGPTVFGLFWGGEEATAAAAAAPAALRDRYPGATAAHPVDAAFAAVRAVPGGAAP